MFEGLRASGNGELHVTSTKCDDHVARALAGGSLNAVGLHGCTTSRRRTTRRHPSGPRRRSQPHVQVPPAHQAHRGGHQRDRRRRGPRTSTATNPPTSPTAPCSRPAPNSNSPPVAARDVPHQHQRRPQEHHPTTLLDLHHRNPHRHSRPRSRPAHPLTPAHRATSCRPRHPAPHPHPTPAPPLGARIGPGPRIPAPTPPPALTAYPRTGRSRLRRASAERDPGLTCRQNPHYHPFLGTQSAPGRRQRSATTSPLTAVESDVSDQAAAASGLWASGNAAAIAGIDSHDHVSV